MTWLTIKELSSYIKLKEKTIYYLVGKRSIPYYRLGKGKLIRFKSEEIDIWLESKKMELIDKKVSKIMESVYNKIEGRPSRPKKGVD